MGDSRNKNAEQKTAEQKFGGDPRTLGDGQVQKGQKNKNSGTKLVGTLRDPKCKYRKVSGTKNAEQKVRNKNLVETLKDPKCKY